MVQDKLIPDILEVYRAVYNIKAKKELSPE